MTVARKTLEASEADVEKAVKSVSLTETGNEQIAEAEQLTVVKRQTVEEARRSLTSAENTLGFTNLRAPFPGVVVRRCVGGHRSRTGSDRRGSWRGHFRSRRRLQEW